MFDAAAQGQMHLKNAAILRFEKCIIGSAGMAERNGSETMLDDLKKRSVKFRSLTEAIDTETPTGRAMWQMIGVLAELERSLIAERTRAGVKDAQKRGVKFGRKPKLSPEQIAHAREQIDKGKRREDVAALLNVNRTTLYRALG